MYISCLNLKLKCRKAGRPKNIQEAEDDRTASASFLTDVVNINNKERHLFIGSGSVNLNTNIRRRTKNLSITKVVIGDHCII